MIRTSLHTDNDNNDNNDNSDNNNNVLINNHFRSVVDGQDKLRSPILLIGL
jgi:hypothetical protein